MKKILLIFSFFFFFPLITFAQSDYDVSIYFFHSDSCSHCMEENRALLRIEDRYPNVRVMRFEIHDDKNISIFEQVKNIYKIDVDAVPLTVIGDQVYRGFSEKSIVRFINTIEYYSIYPYQDRVREIIDQDYVSVPVVKQDVPSLKQFMKTYKSYSVFGIDTDGMDVSTLAFLLGISSFAHIVSILCIVVVFLFLRKIFGFRNKLFLFIFYFICLYLLRFSSVLNIDILTYVVYALLFFLFMVSLLLYCRNRRRQYVVMNCFIMLSLICEYFSKRFYGHNLVILRDVEYLHLMDGFERFIYYGNYFLSIFVADFLFVLLIYLFFQKKIIKN